MIKKVDLLVHIGASATRQDDNTYREQAKAYFNFEGDVVDCSRQDVQSNSREVPPKRINSNDINHAGRMGLLEDETTVFLDDTQLAYNALDSQLITSSFVMPSQVSIRSASQQSRGSQGIGVHSNQLELEACAKDQRTALEDAEQSPQPRNHDYAGKEKHPGEIPAATRNATSTPRAVPDTYPLSQSSYLKSPILDRGSARKKQRLNSNDPARDHALKPIRAASANYIVLPGPSGPGLAYIGDRAIESTETQAEDICGKDGGPGGPEGGKHSYETTSELPTSYSLSDITSESSRARNKASTSQRSASDPGPRVEQGGEIRKELVSGSRGAGKHVVEDVVDTAIAREVDAAPMPAEQNKAKINDTSNAKSNNIRSANNELVKDQASTPLPSDGIERSTGPEKQAQTTNNASNLVLTLHALSREIRPPSPPVGLETYTSHLTPSLIYFSTDSPVKDSYKPVSVTREIRPLERGYWLIDPSPWSQQLQAEFWTFLEKVIGQGSVGWGVWCCREASNGGNRRDRGEEGLGIVKVYCWGEVVEHIYLLLYVASKSQVRKLGLVWVDAEEEVVVRMRKA